METEIRTITPSNAETLLKQAGQNRSLSSSVVQKYARDMREGRWVLNGESIKLNGDGQLIDGQHRLHACIEAGTEFTTVFVTGLPEGAFETLDIGRRRSAGDVLGMDGVDRSNTVAAMGALVWQWEHDVLASSSPAHKPTPPEVVETARRHVPKIEDWSAASYEASTTVGKASLVLGLTYVFSLLDDNDAARFLQSLLDGTGLTKGDPIHLLRERMIQDRISKESLPRREMSALICKAWNLWRAGEKRKLLRWRSVGPKAESFPVPE